jgi:arsenate reductase
VTVCDNAGQACPFFPEAKTTIHASFPDPSACVGIPDESHVQFRRVRDAIITWIDTTPVPEYGNEVLPSKTGVKDMVSG